MSTSGTTPMGIAKMQLQPDTVRTLESYLISYLINLDDTGNLTAIPGVTPEMAEEISAGLQHVRSNEAPRPQNPGIARLLAEVGKHTWAELEQDFFIATPVMEQMIHDIVDKEYLGDIHAQKALILRFGLQGQKPLSYAQIGSELRPANPVPDYQVKRIISNALDVLAQKLVPFYARARFPTAETFPLEYLGLSTKPFNALMNNGYETIADVIAVPASKLLRTTRQFGEGCLEELRAALMYCGYQLP